MQALEVTGKIDDDGFLKIDKPLVVKNRSVKIIILLPEDDIMDDALWLRGLSSNPAFDFLNEPEENIYAPADDKPFRPDEI